jgi:hypothetical protein
MNGKAWEDITDFFNYKKSWSFTKESHVANTKIRQTEKNCQK